MNKVYLKPCPECGGTAVEIMVCVARNQWCIMCFECDFATHHFNSKDAVTEFWNTRATDQEKEKQE